MFKDILEEGSESIGYPPVITGWYMLLHHQENIPNNQENSWAMSCVLQSGVFSLLLGFVLQGKFILQKRFSNHIF